MKVMNYTGTMTTRHSKFASGESRTTARLRPGKGKMILQSPTDHARFSVHVARLLTLQSEITAEAVKSLPLARVISQTDARFRPLVEQLEQLLLYGKAGTSGPHEVVDAPDAVTLSPLTGARARGQQYIATEYKKPENLTLEDASVMAACSDRVLNQRRQNGKVYALLPPGKSRGFRYPGWQFDVAPDRLEAALAPFFAARTGSWVVHNFMLRPNEALDGARPLDYLLDTQKPIGALVVAIVDSLPRDQGAA